MEAIQGTLDEVKELMRGLVERKVNKGFSRFSSCRHALMLVLMTHLDDVAKTCSKRLGDLVAMECRGPYTRNAHYYLDSRAKFTTMMKEALVGRFRPPSQSPYQVLPAFNANSAPGAPAFGANSAPTAPAFNANSAPGATAPSPLHLTTPGLSESQLLQHLASYGIRCSGIRDLFFSQPTQYDPELDMMSACLAYYKVAYKRILDEVPMHINKFLINDFFDTNGKTLYEHAYRSLVSGRAEAEVGGKRSRGIADLLQEDANASNKRRKLQDSKFRLEKAVKVLWDPLIGDDD